MKIGTVGDAFFALDYTCAWGSIQSEIFIAKIYFSNLSAPGPSPVNSGFCRLLPRTETCLTPLPSYNAVLPLGGGIPPHGVLGRGRCKDGDRRL